MKIEDVIRECVVALFTNDVLRRTLVLKGGTALFLTQEIDSRLSTDIDFSISDQIENPDQYFSAIADTLKEHFLKLGYEVFDTDYKKKPREPSENQPRFWGGWYFEFKLISVKNSHCALDYKRRAAMVPDGAASSKNEIEISEYEYCNSVDRVEIEGSIITCYSSTLLVLEKLRAICQQHPKYPYGRLKNRARDYFDIYQLARKHRSPQFYDQLREHLPRAFEAKGVDLGLLKEIFESEFVAYQASHFGSVEAVVKEKPEQFEFYLEQLRLLVAELGYL